MLLRVLLSTISLLMSFIVMAQPNSVSEERTNVVLIIGDDISVDFSAYGGPVQTPNIDAFLVTRL